MTALEKQILDWLWSEVDAHPEEARCARRLHKIEDAVHLHGSSTDIFYQDYSPHPYLIVAMRSLLDGGFIEEEIINNFGFVYFRPLKRAGFRVDGETWQ